VARRGREARPAQPPNTIECLPVITRKTRSTVLEVKSTPSASCRAGSHPEEAYAKTVNIEGQLTSMMARTMILPAALRYQTEVASAVNATKAAGWTTAPSSTC